MIGRTQILWSEELANEERKARASANARGALGVSSPGDNLKDREAATFAAPEPAIHTGRMRLQAGQAAQILPIPQSVIMPGSGL
jgi:hypothetical protein